MTTFYSNCIKLLINRNNSFVSCRKYRPFLNRLVIFRFNYTVVPPGNTSTNSLLHQCGKCNLVNGFKTSGINASPSTNSVNDKKLENYLKNVTIEKLDRDFSIGIDHIIIDLVRQKETLIDNLNQLQSMKEHEKDKEMIDLIQEDIGTNSKKLSEIYYEMIQHLLPKYDFEDCEDIMLEVSPGVGGSEAMLFAGDLRDMYCGFLDFKGWQYHFAENDESEKGGVRHCSLLVSGRGAFDLLQHEAGVHRVQRVPATERSGRVHTSTVSVAVLPQPSDVEIHIKDGDLKIDTKRSSGPGGQHANTTDSAIRITHLPSGIVVECQTDRSQHANKKSALQRLRTMLYERELNQVDTSIRSQRKLQIGTSSRSEKIRTYNYRDDRVSDHRITTNLHNLKQFLEGGKELDDLLKILSKRHHDIRLQQFIDSLPA